MASFSSLIDEDGSLVDLYALLDVPRDADAALLRKRIAQLYLEAQENLDHRNFRRRFYYQELFEVFLPQAHHILLNEKRRAEYNVQLVVRNRGAKASAAAPIASTREAPPSPSLSPATAPPTAAPRQVQPPEIVPRPAPAPVEESLNEEQLQHELQDDLVESLAGDREAQARAEEVIRKRPPTPEWARMDASRVEQRREIRRAALIKEELIATGQRFGVAAACGVGLLCGALAFVMKQALEIQGTAALIFAAIALVAMAGAAFFGWHFASRESRRRVVAQLSRMSYDELLRRCGEG